MDALVQLRNFKDFLLLYNQISETCFKSCTNTFNSREIEDDETACIDNCAQKHIYANNKVMEVYVEIQPVLMKKRIEEANKAQETLQAQMEIEEKAKENTPQDSQQSTNSTSNSL